MVLVSKDIPNFWEIFHSRQECLKCFHLSKNRFKEQLEARCSDKLCWNLVLKHFELNRCLHVYERTGGIQITTFRKWKHFLFGLQLRYYLALKVYPFAKVNFQSQNFGLSTSHSYITTDLFKRYISKEFPFCSQLPPALLALTFHHPNSRHVPNLFDTNF